MDPKVPSTVRAAFVVEGTRGDIQPYVALALKMMHSRGYAVKIFTNCDHVPLCESFRVPAEGVLYNMAEAMADDGIRDAFARGKALEISKCLKDLRMKNFASDITKLWPVLEEFKPTVLLAGTLSKSKGLIYSIDKTLPLVIVDLQIMLPLSDKGPAGLPTLPFGTNGVWFTLILAGAASIVTKTKLIMKEALNVDLDGKYELPLMDALLTKIPTFPGPCCYGLSTLVIPHHPGWPKENFYPCGFFTIDKAQQELMMKDKSKGSQFGADSNAALTAFLAAGPPPVYLGWGSMLCNSPKWMVSLAIEALRHANTRGVLLGGWAGLSGENVPDHLRGYCEENVLFVASAPHEWLFPQCSCIVHHGGCGTTAASVRSGRPTIITPIMGDQFDFAAGVDAIGCGVGLKQLGGIDGVRLGDAIRQCLEEESIVAKAKETGENLRAEDGCEKFCTVFDEWLTDGFASGEWLKKHQALMDKCEESWQAHQNSRCTVS